MADKAPGGKSVGRVTIRVIPDTSKFRTDLKTALDRIEKTTSFTVNVDSVNIDREKVRESIKAQMAGLTQVDVDTNIRALVDKVDVRRVEVRAQLQEAFDEMGLKVRVAVDLTRAQDDIRTFISQVNRKQATININAATSAATAQMRWLSRTRFVDIVPRMNQAAFTAVLTQFAALSGARIAFDWLDDFTNYVAELDRKLPKLGLIISSVTGLVAILMSTLSGLLGLGAGLAAIVPILMTIPGFMIGSALTVTAFAVAMFDARKQLEPLSSNMRELADVIQNTYWDAAREPIINLMNSLRGPLLESFGAVSGALGRFTAGLANAFSQELAGGRLQALFQSMATSIDILTTGTSAFAGALVSLSAIAAEYAPRLAQWFVDISIRFDEWLIEVSNDGRLKGWIDRGIIALEDLGSVLWSTGRIFAALWDAAEAGGGGGIAKLAENMREIATVMEGSKFQGALSALFEGANIAVGFIADGLIAVGNMFDYLKAPLRNLLASAGQSIGIFLQGLSSALSQPAIVNALNALSGALVQMFFNFSQFLPQIVAGFAAIAQVAAALAPVLGNVLGAVLAALTPSLEAIADALLPIIPLLGEAMVGAINILAPILLNLLEAILPIMVPLLQGIAAALVWLSEEVFPVFEEFWQEHLVKPFTAFIEEHGPAFERVWREVIAPVIDFFVNNVMPPLLNILGELWNFIADNLMSALEEFAKWFEDPNNKGVIMIFTGIIIFLVSQLMTLPTVLTIIVAALSWLINVLIIATNAWNNFWSASNQAKPGDPSKPFATSSYIRGIKPPATQASGGITMQPGLSWVGEQGPELLSLPKGARVLPLDRLPIKDGLSGSGAGTLNYYAAPNASFDAEQELFTAMRRSKVVAGW